MNELVSVGYATIDTIDEKSYYGGAAAGVAINAAKLHSTVELIAPFGTDATSLSFLRFLQEQGIKTSNSLQQSFYHVPQNTISHTDRTKGWNDFSLTSYLEITRLPTKPLQKATTVHLASAHYTWVQQAFKTRHENVSFSPGPKVCIDQRYAPLDILSKARYVFLNEAEWNALQRYYCFETQADLIHLGSEAIVTTYGGQGTVLTYRSRKQIVTKSYTPEQHPDPETSGAGDAIALGFLLGQWNGASFDDSVLFGMDIAAEIIKTPGVILSNDAVTRLQKKVVRL